MAKKKRDVVPFVIPEPGEAQLPAPVSEIRPPVYSFPTKCRCPRCHGAENDVVRTHGEVRYMRCRLVVCGTSFKVQGTRI